MSLGYRLKQARLRKNMTQETLAKVVGVSKGSIGNYESGVSSPNEPILIKLLEVLEIDANFLYQDFVQADASLSDQDKAVLESLHQNPQLGLLFDRSSKMSPSDVDFMLQMADRILKERDPDG